MAWRSGPGDLIIGDDDGVVAVPLDDVNDELLARCRARLVREGEGRMRMTKTDTTAAWCSDACRRACCASCDIAYVALSPGSSFRGLHESLVNLLGNRQPEMLLCLHEEHAVAIAHGWAKVTGTPMGVLVHANVGLMHATMAVYNAFCDRVPMLIMGGVAPMDAGPAHFSRTLVSQRARSGRPRAGLRQMG